MLSQEMTRCLVVFAFSLFTFALVLTVAGCHKDPARVDGNAKPSEGSAPPINNAQDEKASNIAVKEAPRPLGNYVLSEVQHEGQVTMISVANTTEFNFLADGTYLRVSKKGGKVDHRDSGQYSMEGADKLVLAIAVSDQKVQTAPVRKIHTFTLSPDGEELRLTAGDGKIAVFRRMAGK